MKNGTKYDLNRNKDVIMQIMSKKKRKKFKRMQKPMSANFAKKNVIGVSYDEASVIGVYGLTFINTNKKVI